MLGRKGAAPATDRAVSRGRKVQRRQLSKPHSLTRQIFAVCDGRFAVGVVKTNASGFVALDTAGEIIGEFETLREAARAIPTKGEAS
jgi:hypothetical protein